MATEFFRQFWTGLLATGWLEAIAVIAGIVSVWFSRQENILVYPTGLVSTIIYVYISFNGHLLGEVAVNVFYTIMSVYGWVLWARKDRDQHYVLHISRSDTREWMMHLTFFLVLYIVIYFSLVRLKEGFASGALPGPDAFASASAFTGMWLMAKKKVESWIWWIVTNIASVPLYYVKGYVFTSVFYFVLLLMAVSGLVEWQKKFRAQRSRDLKDGLMAN